MSCIILISCLLGKYYFGIEIVVYSISLVSLAHLVFRLHSVCTTYKVKFPGSREDFKARLLLTSWKINFVSHF